METESTNSSSTSTILERAQFGDQCCACAQNVQGIIDRTIYLCKKWHKVLRDWAAPLTHTFRYFTLYFLFPLMLSRFSGRQKSPCLPREDMVATRSTGPVPVVAVVEAAGSGDHLLWPPKPHLSSRARTSFIT